MRRQKTPSLWNLKIQSSKLKNHWQMIAYVFQTSPETFTFQLLPFLFINKTLRLNNLKTRTAMDGKISVSIICVAMITYLLWYDLHDSTFKYFHYLSFPYSIGQNFWLISLEGNSGKVYQNCKHIRAKHYCRISKEAKFS